MNAIEFRNMAALRVLELASHRGGIDELPPGIERLSVQGCKWATLDPVAGLRDLRDLQLVSRQLRSLEGIEGCETLVRLGFAYAKLERPFQESKVRSSTVRQLILDTCSKLSSLEGVGEALPDLRRLALVNLPALESVKPLAATKKLENIRIAGRTRVGDNDLSPLAGRDLSGYVQDRKGYQPRAADLGLREISVGHLDHLSW